MFGWGYATGGNYPTPPEEPAVDVEVFIDPEAERIRHWVHDQMVREGVDPFIAYRLALIPGIDYRRVLYLKSKGMPDAQILDEFLDYGED